MQVDDPKTMALKSTGNFHAPSMMISGGVHLQVVNSPSFYKQLGFLYKQMVFLLSSSHPPNRVPCLQGTGLMHLRVRGAKQNYQLDQIGNRSINSVLFPSHAFLRSFEKNKTRKRETQNHERT